MRDFARIEQSLNINDKLEMAIYHECRRLQKHLQHYEGKDIVLASMYGIMATSLSAILSEKTGRMTREELQNLMSTLDDFITRTTIASEEIVRMEMLHPIYDIINGSELDPGEAYPVLISILEKFKKLIESQKADSSIIRSVESLIEHLKNEVRRIGIIA